MDEKTRLSLVSVCLIAVTLCFSSASLSQSESDQRGVQTAQELIELYLAGNNAGTTEEKTRGLSVNRGIAGVRKGDRQKGSRLAIDEKPIAGLALASQEKRQSNNGYSAGSQGNDGADQSNQLDFQNIVFESGSFLIPSKSYRQLDEVGLALSTLVNRFPTMSFIIEGHTDSLGNDDENQTLSFNRATAIKRFLSAKHSISSKRLTAVGVGEQEPIASNSTTQGRAKNRRVRIISRL